jgi:hypothetical protein
VLPPDIYKLSRGVRTNHELGDGAQLLVGCAADVEAAIAPAREIGRRFVNELRRNDGAIVRDEAKDLAPGFNRPPPVAWAIDRVAVKFDAQLARRRKFADEPAQVLLATQGKHAIQVDLGVFVGQPHLERLSAERELDGHGDARFRRTLATGTVSRKRGEDRFGLIQEHALATDRAPAALQALARIDGGNGGPQAMARDPTNKKPAMATVTRAIKSTYPLRPAPLRGARRRRDVTLGVDCCRR